MAEPLQSKTSFHLGELFTVFIKISATVTPDTGEPESRLANVSVKRLVWENHRRASVRGRVLVTARSNDVTLSNRKTRENREHNAAPNKQGHLSTRRMDPLLPFDHFFWIGNKSGIFNICKFWKAACNIVRSRIKISCKLCCFCKGTAHSFLGIR